MNLKNYQKKRGALFVLMLTSLLLVGWSWGGKKTSSKPQAIQQAIPATYNPNIFVNLSKKVVPSVVNISTQVERMNMGHKRAPDLFRKYFEEFYRKQHSTAALGTGVIIEVKSNKAIVLTNQHVIKNASKVKVQFNKDATGVNDKLNAKIIGQDPELDLALVQVPIKKEWKLKALPFGNSDAIQVGEYVMAVGNPFGQGHSVSHGIISAKGREAPIIGNYLQTDAPINPGNSGGPLVNLKGEIIGINNAILARAQGIGFAIPSNSIQNILSEFKDTGKVERGYIGIMMGAISPEAAAFSGEQVSVGQPFVLQVEENGPANKGGIQPNDVILKVEDIDVGSPSELKSAVASQPINKKIKLEILRKGKRKILHLKVGKRKA